MDTSRLLIDPDAQDAETYKIQAVARGRSVTIAQFRTGGVNGKSADDTALGNLMDASEGEPDVLELWKLTVAPGGTLPVDVQLATAQHGIATMVA